ncbi:MAG TPA: ABC transporter ATP-binding protein [Methylomusa anaerophila]|uniref:Hemin import ATP-binding protein HmuV n=1 Tax=Methylomusa anaerophila TaxID=1930071 RepID=A0A348AEG3_9FIRM|nr:ABC transporter ATP-binding protein [Methylomusa anaerophila]BBB89461.1 hemin import ATP-binding protein HmuV [Methylomusa anaerophila]HML89693.1 ABC transporter ATP-binding protein [Methylomusa anaerophila]
MIRAENVCFSYGRQQVLHNVSLDIAAGEVVTLLGPNGSGKTTLLKCLTGTVRPSGGKIIINGQDMASLKPRQIARLAAVLFQNHTPFFPYKVRDVALMGRAPYVDGFLSGPDKSDNTIVEEVLTELAIVQFADRLYTELSGGERQLVLLARALVQQPRLLVLDEPTAPLDFKNIIKTLQTVRRLAKDKQLAVIMSLHDPNHTLMFSDKAALVKKGEIKAFGPADQVINEVNLAELYEMAVNVIEYQGVRFVAPNV